MIVVSGNLYAHEISCVVCTSSSLCDWKITVFATTEHIACPDSPTVDDECVNEERIQDSDDKGQSDVDTGDDVTDSEEDTAQDDIF